MLKINFLPVFIQIVLQAFSIYLTASGLPSINDAGSIIDGDEKKHFLLEVENGSIIQLTYWPIKTNGSLLFNIR